MIAFLTILLSCQKTGADLWVSVSQVQRTEAKVSFVVTVQRGELPALITVNINNGSTNVISEKTVVTSREPVLIKYENPKITTQSGVWVYWSNKNSTGITGIKL